MSAKRTVPAEEAPPSTAVTEREVAAVLDVIVRGDLSKLSPDETVNYYRAVCQSLGLNPLTQPFAYLTLSGRKVLYATKACTDQLRALRRVSITRIERETIEGVCVVTVYAATPDGRTDSDVGAVTIAGLKGDTLANAIMKAISKAKRRVTLAICGLGMLDESELETLPGRDVPRVSEAPRATAVQVEHKPAPPPAPPAGQPKRSPDPLAGLDDHVHRYDAYLVDIGLCADGDLLRHMAEFRRRYTGDIARAPREYVDAALAEVKAFHLDREAAAAEAAGVGD